MGYDIRGKGVWCASSGGGASLSHLTVVFRNILDNAIKFTPAGGTIIWAIARDGAALHHRIKDTGPGIDAHDLPLLFTRFYRGDRARSRDIPGTGLGLALVYSIVTAYGGTITIISGEAGQGTTVEIWWPLGTLA